MIYNLPPDVLRHIAELEKRIERLERAPRAVATSVDSGQWSVVDPQTGNTIFAVGNYDIPDGTGRTQMAVAIYRDDTTVAMAMGDWGPVPNHPHLQSIDIRDRLGNIIFADDTLSGKGLARPYSPYPFLPILPTNVPTTTSATFVDVGWASVTRQHPRFYGQALVYSNDPATTGEVRFMVGASQIGSTITVSGSQFNVQTITPTDWPGGYVYSDKVTLLLQARRTGGTGAIGALAWGEGEQS